MASRVSVVIPVYNGAATLAGCLDAIYASDAADYEVIVVDDGSNDATREVATRYPCRLVVLPTNMGAARAKNHGAGQATGDILFFTDADVHIQPTALSLLVEDLADSEVDGVVGLLGRTCPYSNFASQFKNLWMHFTYRRQPRRVGLFFTSAAGIRRTLFEQEGGFDPHYAGASITEDIEFGQRLLGRGYQIVMDQRLTVEHQKRYALGEVLRTDLLRARGLVQTWLRNRLSGSQRAHYASVPWYFGAGVLAMGLATLMALCALIAWDARLLIGTGLLVLAALMLNSPFLVSLERWNGPAFGLQSAGFVLLDLYASGLGIVWGLLDFMRGEHY